MKPYRSIIYFVIMFFPHFLIAQPTVSALSKEDLTPFCSNEIIWSNYNISPDQCLNVAVSCSSDIAKQNIGIELATEKLYSCVFTKLGIDFPE